MKLHVLRFLADRGGLGTAADVRARAQDFIEAESGVAFP